jgi:hypothetical protein
MSLFAGTIYSFKYSVFIEIVKKLKLNLSAGFNICSVTLNNIHYHFIGTSETLRDKIITISENIKDIPKHVPKHLKPNNDNLIMIT